MFDVAAGIEGAAATTGEDNGEVGVSMAITISVAAAVNDLGIAEEGIAVGVFRVLHFF